MGNAESEVNNPHGLAGTETPDLFSPQTSPRNRQFTPMGGSFQG